MENNNQSSRRKFIQQSGVIGASLMLAGSTQFFAQTNKVNNLSSNIKSKGYAGKFVEK